MTSSFLYTDRDPLDRFKNSFLSLPTDITHFYIAFSGGLDSYVLLHATHLLFPQKNITAIHIHHGLQPEANDWQAHCKMVCDTLNLPFVARSVQPLINQYKKEGDSPEDAARKARYNAFAELLDSKSCLLTGHHLEDQAETLLLQLMRGAGVKGLGAMRALTSLRNVYHLRPLLSWDRKERLAYAEQYQLKWIEDPSNQDQQFRRNFVRHSVIPTLQKNWPRATHTLSRAALYCKEASDLCLEIAENDISSCKVETHILSIKKLLSLSLIRQRNTLRYWFYQNRGNYPSITQLEGIEKLVYSHTQKVSTFEANTTTIKRYRDFLYFIKKENTHFEQYSNIQWSYRDPIRLPSGAQLKATLCEGRGVRRDLLLNHVNLEIRFRQGGERFHPQGRKGSHPLKKLFQEWGIPPWMRSHWPLIYHNNQLMAVPNYAVSKEAAASSKEVGLWISMTHSSTIAF